MRGFSIFREGGMENHLVVDVVRQDLTRELSKVTVPLTEETAYVLKLLLTDNTGRLPCGSQFVSFAADERTGTDFGHATNQSGMK